MVGEGSGKGAAGQVKMTNASQRYIDRNTTLSACPQRARRGPAKLARNEGLTEAGNDGPEKNKKCYFLRGSTGK